MIINWTTSGNQDIQQNFGFAVWNWTAGPAIGPGGCWAEGQSYSPGYKQGQSYQPGYKQGQSYSPGYKQGERVC